MTTPSDPTTPQDAPATPDPATSQAQHDAEVDAELRQLAAEIAKQNQLGFEPTQIRKAIITAVNDATAPPTVSLNISGDTETLVTEVRTLNNYTPIVGNTVLMAKQGSEIFILGQIAGTNPYTVGASGDGWIALTPANGTNGGNSNGNIYYRRVLDHGTWKMQWRGGWSPAGSTTLVGIGGLGSDYRPSSKRSVLAAREISTGSNVVQFDFQTDGSVNLVGGNVACLNAATTNETGILTSYGDPAENTGGTSQTHTHVYNTSSVTSGQNQSHTHGLSNLHQHTLFGHSHTAQNYVSPPGWVSLNGVEYFL